MDKWILLIFTCITVYAAFEAILWFIMMQKSPSKDIENTMGYSTSGKSPNQRERSASFYKSSPYGLFIGVFVILIIAITMLISTYNAFFV